jgi:hypothetical protein
MGLLLAAGSARAATCSAEIMTLQKQIEQTPKMATSTIPNPAAGPAPLPAPDTAAPMPGSTLGAPPASDSIRVGRQAHAAPNGSGEAGSRPGSDQLRGTGANGGILMQNGSNTPKPAETQPMDSDTAQAAQPKTDAGTDAAAKSLMRARALDQVGDEAGCKNAVDQAKNQLSQR